MKTSIPNKKKKKLFSRLEEANTAFQKTYPGDRSERQPVHTVYGGANLFKSNSAKILGERALESFQTYAPDFLTFGRIFGLEGINEIYVNYPADLTRQSYEILSPEERRKH